MTKVAVLLRRLAVAALLATGLGIAAASTAAAHDVLISSNPADGATLSAAPSSLVFTFDQPVQNYDPVVSLVGPGGRQFATGTPTISGNVVTGTVTAGPAGAYTGAYRIVSADGHPVTGEIHFTLTGGAGSAGAGAPSSGVLSSGVPAAPAAGAPAAKSGGFAAGLWIGLAVAVVLVAAAAVIMLRPSGTKAGGHIGRRTGGAAPGGAAGAPGGAGGKDY